MGRMGPSSGRAHRRYVRIRHGPKHCTESARGSFDGNDKLVLVGFDDLHADHLAGQKVIVAWRSSAYQLVIHTRSVIECTPRVPTTHMRSLSALPDMTDRRSRPGPAQR